MNQLHEQRSSFVQKVRQVFSVDLAMNGLELRSVSLTGALAAILAQARARGIAIARPP